MSGDKPTSEPLIIQAGAYAAGIVPELGGSIAWLRHDGRDLLRPLSEPVEAGVGAQDTAMFPMLPFCNRIAGSRLAWRGEIFEVAPNVAGEDRALHGYGWIRPWTIDVQSENQVDLVLRDVTLPFDFAARETFSLSEAGLRATLAVTNCGKKSLPFGIGFHPWFTRARGVVWQFKASGYWLAGNDALPSDRISLPPELDHCDGRALPAGWRNNCYDGWDGRLRIDYPTQKLAVDICADPIFGHLMVYADPERDSFCLEPQSHLSGSFGRETPDHPLTMAELAPGETLSGSIHIACSAR